MTDAAIRPHEPPCGGKSAESAANPGAVEALYPNVEILASGGSEPCVPVRPRPSEEGLCEEHIARVKKTLTKPSSAEVASNETTHCPFRS